MNLGVIFLTGLTTGGLTCLAVQGGLLATAITRQVTVTVAQPQPGAAQAAQTGIQMSKTLWPVIYFLAGKLVAYGLLGFLLGLLGSAVQITPAVQSGMLIAAGLFMVATALNMLNVHPIFRYFVIQPPKGLTRLVRNQAKSEEVFAPALLGLMTVFIPCGTTQAMEVLVIGSGLALQGAAIMAVYILGTMPTFVALGFVATQGRGKARSALAMLAAVLVLGMGLYTLNSGLKLANSPFVPSRALVALMQPPDLDTAVRPTVVDGVQELTLNVYPTSYTPNYLSARSNAPIRLWMVTNNSYG